MSRRRKRTSSSSSSDDYKKPSQKNKARKVSKLRTNTNGNDRDPITPKQNPPNSIPSPDSSSGPFLSTRSKVKLPTVQPPRTGSKSVGFKESTVNRLGLSSDSQSQKTKNKRTNETPLSATLLSLVKARPSPPRLDQNSSIPQEAVQKSSKIVNKPQELPLTRSRQELKTLTAASRRAPENVNGGIAKENKSSSESDDEDHADVQKMSYFRMRDRQAGLQGTTPRKSSYDGSKTGPLKRKAADHKLQTSVSKSTGGSGASLHTTAVNSPQGIGVLPTSNKSAASTSSGGVGQNRQSSRPKDDNRLVINIPGKDVSPVDPSQLFGNGFRVFDPNRDILTSQDSEHLLHPVFFDNQLHIAIKRPSGEVILIPECIPWMTEQMQTSGVRLIFRNERRHGSSANDSAPSQTLTTTQNPEPLGNVQIITTGLNQNQMSTSVDGRKSGVQNLPVIKPKPPKKMNVRGQSPPSVIYLGPCVTATVDSTQNNQPEQQGNPFAGTNLTGNSEEISLKMADLGSRIYDLNGMEVSEVLRHLDSVGKAATAHVPQVDFNVRRFEASGDANIIGSFCNAPVDVDLTPAVPSTSKSSKTARVNAPTKAAVTRTSAPGTEDRVRRSSKAPALFNAVSGTSALGGEGAESDVLKAPPPSKAVPGFSGPGTAKTDSGAFEASSFSNAAPGTAPLGKIDITPAVLAAKPPNPSFGCQTSPNPSVDFLSNAAPGTAPLGKSDITPAVLAAKPPNPSFGCQTSPNPSIDFQINVIHISDAQLSRTCRCNCSSLFSRTVSQQTAASSASRSVSPTGNIGLSVPRPPTQVPNPSSIDPTSVPSPSGPQSEDSNDEILFLGYRITDLMEKVIIRKR